MSRYLKILSNYLQKLGFWRIAILALVVRLVLGFFFSGGDVENHAIWGIYSREFGFSGFYDFLNFGNYARPNYPPLATILFWMVRAVWEVIFELLWRINLILPVFPSNIIPWFQKEGYLILLKLPAILADIGIGFILFKYLRKKLNEKSALIGSMFYLFNPATIYISSMWGQIDSLVVLAALSSLMLLEQRKLVLGLLLFTISLLLKPTMLTIAPVVIYLLWKSRPNVNTLVRGVAVSGFFSIAVSSLFTPSNPLLWLFRTYLFKFVLDPASVPYIQVRAFNFWAILTGAEFVHIESIKLGLPLSLWSIALSVPILLAIGYLLFKKGRIWLAATLFVFASFLFLPRVHERYLLPVIAMMIPFVMMRPGIKWVFLATSLLHFLNLYGAWQVPYSFFVQILNLDLVIRFASLSTVVLFFLLFKTALGSKK